MPRRFPGLWSPARELMGRLLWRLRIVASHIEAGEGAFPQQPPQNPPPGADGLRGICGADIKHDTLLKLLTDAVYNYSRASDGERSPRFPGHPQPLV